VECAPGAEMSAAVRRSLPVRPEYPGEWQAHGKMTPGGTPPTAIGTFGPLGQPQPNGRQADCRTRKTDPTTDPTRADFSSVSQGIAQQWMPCRVFLEARSPKRVSKDESRAEAGIAYAHPDGAMESESHCAGSDPGIGHSFADCPGGNRPGGRLPQGNAWTAMKPP